ncbi:MAG: bacteriocin immunity protein [Prevotella sp.]|jgi:hypothetical protein|nr:bacteriocin immunity protein [Prevotella sp.]
MATVINYKKYKIMTRDELIKLVNEIMNVQGKSEKQIDELIDILMKNVPHPAVTDLIYWDNLTAEEIVDKALSYKPIQLCPPLARTFVRVLPSKSNPFLLRNTQTTSLRQRGAACVIVKSNAWLYK